MTAEGLSRFCFITVKTRLSRSEVATTSGGSRELSAGIERHCDLYFRGEGLGQHYLQAASWYREAADLSGTLTRVLGSSLARVTV